MTMTMDPPANALATQPNGNSATPVQTQRREIRIVEDTGILSNLMDTARFEHLQRLSMLMAKSSLLPEHLCLVGTKGNKQELPMDVIAANCFRIVNQAIRWGFDPFAIIDETYVVSGKLGYQGKLVAGVVNTRAGLLGRLSYSFAGKGDDLTVTVSGSFPGEDKPRTATLRVGDAKTDNQMWKKDPEQKLIYSGVVKWARRHCPEVVLGVITDDDLDRMQQATLAEAANSTTDRLNAKLKAGLPQITTGAAIEQQTKEAPGAAQTISAPPSDAPGSSVVTGQPPKEALPGDDVQSAMEQGDEGQQIQPDEASQITAQEDYENWLELMWSDVQRKKDDRMTFEGAMNNSLLAIGKKGKGPTTTKDERGLIARDIATMRKSWAYLKVAN